MLKHKLYSSIKNLTKKKPESSFSKIWDFWSPVIATLLLYLGVRNFIAEARYIPSGSMLPSLQINDKLIIEKLTFRKRSPKRGEIVVFNSPHSFDKELLSRRDKPLPSSTTCGFLSLPMINLLPGIGDRACDAYIKRVVAVEGDWVFVNSRGEVYVDDAFVDEAYIERFCSYGVNNLDHCSSLKAYVPKGHVFVLGDNRPNSWDGRFWPGGKFLPEEQIIGRAVWRFWPINRIGSITE